MFRVVLFAVLTFLLSRELGDGSVKMESPAVDAQSVSNEMLAETVAQASVEVSAGGAGIIPEQDTAARADEKGVEADAPDMELLAGATPDIESSVSFDAWSTMPFAGYLVDHDSSEGVDADAWSTAAYGALAQAVGFGGGGRKSKANADEQKSDTGTDTGTDGSTQNPADDQTEEEAPGQSTEMPLTETETGGAGDDEDTTPSPYQPPYGDKGSEELPIDNDNPVSVPEPSTAPLFALGLAALMFALRRERAPAPERP